MKDYVFKKIVLSLSFVFASVLIELVLFKFIQNGGVPEFWLIDYSAYLILGFLFFLLPLTISKILSIIGVTLNAILSITNMILYCSSGRFFEWKMMTLLNEATGVTDWIIVPWVFVILTIVVTLLFIVVTLLFVRKAGVYYKKFVKSVLSVMSIIFMAIFLAIHSITRVAIINDYEVETYFISNSYRYTVMDSARDGILDYGLWGYYSTSLARILFPKITPKLKVNISDFNFERYSSELQGLCEGDNVLVIIGESMDEFAINPELTPTLYALKNGIDLSNVGVNNFYNINSDGNGGRILERRDFVKVGDHYSYTGVDIFDGLESQKVGLDLVCYKSDEATNFSEYRVLSGNAMTCNYSLPKMMKTNGYNTSYVHGNDEEFYSRGLWMREQYQFDNCLFAGDLASDIETTGNVECYLRDSDIVNYYKSHEEEFDIIPDDKFLSVFMTITAHGKYSKSWDIVSENLDFVKYVSSIKTDGVIGAYNSLDPELKSAVGNFWAKAIDTEKMISLLVDELFQDGKLEKTIIVYATDHNAYANNLNIFKERYYKEVLGKTWNGGSDIYNVPAFVYSTKINSSSVVNYSEKRQVTHYTSAVDIVPTVLTMLNIDYIQERYIGNAVLNNSVVTGECVYNRVVKFNYSGSFVGDGFVTNGIVVDSLKQFTEAEVVDIRKMCDMFNRKKYFIQYVLSQGDSYIPIE